MIRRAASHVALSLAIAFAAACSHGNAPKPPSPDAGYSAVIETANKATNGLREILRLKQECLEVRIPRIGRQTSAAPKLLNHLFQQPIVWAEEVMKATGQSSPSAYKIRSDFGRIGILRAITYNT